MPTGMEAGRFAHEKRFPPADDIRATTNADLSWEKYFRRTLLYDYDASGARHLVALAVALPVIELH